MTRIAYIIIGLLVSALGLGAYAYLKPGGEEGEEPEEAGGGVFDAGLTLPDVEPPQENEQGQPEPPEILDTDQGRGGRLVRERMKALNSAAKQDILGQSQPLNFYGGVGEFKTVLMTVLGNIFGGANNLPVYSFDLQPTWNAFLQDIQDAERLDPMSQGGQIDRAIQNWKSLVTFGPTQVSFWPPNLAELIEQGFFKASGPGDSDRSERYGAFADGMKVVAKNLQRISDQYTKNLKARAIADLVGAGYKFYGINE